MNQRTVIADAKIIDGTGNPWFYGDVAIVADRIETIASARTLTGDTVVDAQGKVVCPGFIDIQSHSILPLMVDGRAISKLTQGVTTEIMGEAWTPAPVKGRNTEPLANILFTLDVSAWEERIAGWSRFGDWLTAMVDHGVSPNIGSFLGGGTLRTVGVGMEMRPATPSEMELMKAVMVEAMEDGAFGVSYALIYPPDAYTDTTELVEICRVVAEHNGLYITHIRDEGDGLQQALDEAIEIGRRSGTAVEIYHLKASGPQNWHKIPAVIEQINRVRVHGLDITADMYPYAASGTGLTAVLPPYAMADGKLFENLSDPAIRARIKAEMLRPSGDWEPMGSRDPAGVMPIGFEQPQNKQYTAMRLTEIAQLRGQDWVDTVFDLLLSENQRISTIYFSMDEANVCLQLQQPWITVATDAGGLDPAWAEPLGPYHPRAYGTYPRVLGRYVREQGLLTLEEAVRKMSGAVAQRLRLRDRGFLREGAFADVVIFDPDTVIDHATFEDSHQLSTGVEHVWVNGVVVVEDGVHTGAKPGVVVRPG